eukprot:scaffold17996_cov55-Cyclotella_meneghiniana.AAC.1
MKRAVCMIAQYTWDLDINKYGDSMTNTSRSTIHHLQLILISMIYLHQFLDYAEDSPLRQAVLLQLRYAEISKLLRTSARIGQRGSVKHFLTALRFGLTLWTVTHAVDYVRLATDILQLYHCASLAMRALYDNEIFTRLTASGESIATDENIEKSIGHMFKVITHKQLVGSM